MPQSIGYCRSRQFAARGLGAVIGVLLGLVLLAAVVGVFWAGSYNRLVGLDTEVDRVGGNLQAQIKRRADLVPNLVATVKGYASHERGVFSDIAQARSRLLSADVATNPTEAAAANRNFGSALGRLLALSENYPQLKADQNFTRLQDEISGTENRINYARVQFNDAVRDYNLAVRAFPSSIIAGVSGFERKPMFQADPADQAAPKVAF